MSAVMCSRIAALSTPNTTSRLSLVLGGVRFFSTATRKNSAHADPSKDRIASVRFLGILLKVVEWSAFFVPMGSLETLSKGRERLGV